LIEKNVPIIKETLDLNPAVCPCCGEDLHDVADALVTVFKGDDPVPFVFNTTE
jgi:hypothetical protein